MVNKTLSIDIKRVLIWDFIAFSFVLIVPAISHMTSFPLYKFEPMRLLLFFNLLILGEKKNAFVLSVALPLFSFLFSGHPFLPKAIVMSLELFVNVFVLFQLMNKINTTLAVFLSIVLSKLCFYGLKYAIISLGWLNTTLIETDIIIQLIVALAISLAYTLFYKNKIASL